MSGGGWRRLHPPVRRYFSIAKLGEREAKRRAIEMRAAMVEYYKAAEATDGLMTRLKNAMGRKA